MTSEYRKAYDRGWKASKRLGTLERADSRGEASAWYDGYHDYAAGREQYHIPNCPRHAWGECEG